MWKKLLKILDFQNYLNRSNIANTKRFEMPVIFGLAVFISLVHYLTFNREEIGWLFFHSLLTKMYFLPVLLAAFWDGKRGAVILSMLVTIIYLPHAFIHLSTTRVEIIENLSEIALLWLIGGIAGYLIDRLKKSQAERSKLAALDKVSGILNVINHDIMIDYNACSGLAKALEKSSSNTSGNTLSTRILRERLEHLGLHLNHLKNLALPEKLIRQNYNLVHLVKKSVTNTIGKNNHLNIKFNEADNLPPIPLNVKQIDFAVTNILETLINNNDSSEQLMVTFKEKKGAALIEFDLHKRNGQIHIKKWDHLDMYGDSQNGYAFSLALSTIHFHGGRLEYDNNKDGKISIRLYLPIGRR